MKNNDFNEKVLKALNKNSDKKDIEIETVDQILNIKVGDLCRVKDLIGYKVEIMAAVDDENKDEQLHDNEINLNTNKAIATMCLIDNITSLIPVGSSTNEIVTKGLINDPVEFFDILHNLFHMAIDYFARIRESGLKDQNENPEEDSIMQEIETLHKEFQVVFLNMFKNLKFEEYCKALMQHKFEEIKNCQNEELKDELKLKLENNKTLMFIKEISKFEEKFKNIKKENKKPTVIVIGRGTDTIN